MTDTYEALQRAKLNHRVAKAARDEIEQFFKNNRGSLYQYYLLFNGTELEIRQKAQATVCNTLNRQVTAIENFYYRQHPFQ